MQIKSGMAVVGFILCSTLASASAFAQDVPGHPRVNEVDQRLDNQQNRIQNGEANGTVNGRQAARDETHDANIARRASRDEAANGGHLTKREKTNLNKSLNKDSSHIYKQKH